MLDAHGLHSSVFTTAVGNGNLPTRFGHAHLSRLAEGRVCTGCATYAPEDLLDSLVDSHQNGGRLGGEVASSPGTTTAMDNGLVKVSLNLLTEEEVSV